MSVFLPVLLALLAVAACGAAWVIERTNEPDIAVPAAPSPAVFIERAPVAGQPPAIVADPSPQACWAGDTVQFAAVK